MRQNADEFRILSATAILGYGFPESSFEKGLRRKPHLIAVDAGSTDPGPYYLGSGKSFTSRTAVKRDLRLMIKAGLRLGVPVIVGSAGGSGARPHVDWCTDIIREIAREERLQFKLGIIYTDVPKELVKKAVKKNGIRPLSCVPPLTSRDVDESTNIVAQVGVEPFIKALEQKCDVILCGRSYDPAVFAAAPISRGFDPGLALHLGKILECAAIAATPGSGADCAMGTLRKDAFVLEALSPERRFTTESAAAHTLYEKSDPYFLPGPGGTLDLTKCIFKDIGRGQVEVSGSKLVKTPGNWVKIEGARQVGFRTISIAGVRDPIMIKQIDPILRAVEAQVRQFLKREKSKGKICFHVYGRDGVMGDREPVRQTQSHELCVLMDAVGETQVEAETLISLTRSTLLHYGYAGRIATAGNLAFPFSPSEANMGAVYEFSIYHLMELDQQKLFPVKAVFVR